MTGERRGRLRDAVVAERRRLARRVLFVRPILATVFAAMGCIVLLALGEDLARWQPYLVPVALYALTTWLLFLARHARIVPTVAVAMCVADVALVFLVERHGIRLAREPLLQLGESVAILMITIVLSALTLSSRAVVSTTLAALAAAIGLIHITIKVSGAPIATEVLATASFLCIVGGLCLAAQKRMLSLAWRWAGSETARETSDERRRATEEAGRMIQVLLDEAQWQNSRLEEAKQKREELSHMLVHDMRTPLSSMVALLEITRHRLSNGGGNLDQSLGYALKEASRLDEMMKQLLDIAKLEEGRMPLSLQPTPLPAMVHDVVETAHPPAQARRITLEVHVPDAAVANLDGGLIRRALANMLANALRFTPPEGRVRVVVERDAKATRLFVHNDGPTIAADRRGIIFDKFTGDASRSNWGIGLYFCRLVAEAHRGAIAVEDHAGWGCSFVLRLPDDRLMAGENTRG